MRIDILTIFPEIFRGPLDVSIIRRAVERGLVEIAVHDIRDHATDKHRTVDNPMAENWRLATGFNYQVDAGLDLHMAYTLVWMGDMQVQQSKELSGQTLSGPGHTAELLRTPPGPTRPRAPRC